MTAPTTTTHDNHHHLLPDLLGGWLTSFICPQSPTDSSNASETNTGDLIVPQQIQRLRADEIAAPMESNNEQAHSPQAHISTDVDPSMVDSIIAQEIASLSIEDREKVLYDIHGISGGIEETKELVESSLHMLEIELDKLQQASGYQIAFQMDRCFVEDKMFRLRFLRAHLFDAAKAAEGIATHFEVKLELFGLELLTKDITQDDLDKDTMGVIYSGRIQRLPQRDRGGRVVGIRFHLPSTVPVMAQLRAMFYLGMAAAEDEETQKKGHVTVSCVLSEDENLFHSFHHRRELNLKMSKVIEGMPNRYVGFHFVHNFSVAWRLLLAIFKLATKQSNRIRIREHCGDREEFFQSLRAFGIPTDDFPLDERGNILTEFHIMKMEKRRIMERFRQQRLTTDQPLATRLVTPETRNRVVTPSNNDVLLGRGKASYQHIGNVRLRHWIEQRRPAYEGASVVEKAKMSAEIVALIKQSTGRFLKEDEAGWFEVPDQVAKKKVSHAFRTLRYLHSKGPSI